MKKNPPGSFYRHILRDAWNVTRKNKVLWIFGFFVSFLGAGGVYELLVQGTGKLGLNQDFGSYLVLSALVPTGPEILTTLGNLGAANSIVLVLFGIAALGVLAVAVWIIVSSQGAIIHGIRDAHKRKKLRFSKLFAAGSEVFGRLFIMNLLSRFAIAASFYLILSLMLLLLAKGTLFASLLYLAAFLVLMPLTLIIGFITIYAAAYITLNRMKLVDAVETALFLFRKYWLISLEIAVILFAINIAVSLGVGLLFSFLAVMFLPLIIGASLVGANVGLWIALGLAGIVGVALLVLVGAGLITYQYSVWTLLFMKLHVRGHRGISKLVRMLGHFVK